MPVRRTLGKTMAQIQQEQAPFANKILNLSSPEGMAKLLAAEKAKRIKEVEKIPFKRRYASPKEITAFYDIISRLREVSESVQIEHTDMEIAKRVLELGKGRIGPRIRKSDVQNAFKLLKKYGPQRIRPKMTK